VRIKNMHKSICRHEDLELANVILSTPVSYARNLPSGGYGWLIEVQYNSVITSAAGPITFERCNRYSL
jgi:hypothetical protein